MKQALLFLAVFLFSSPIFSQEYPLQDSVDLIKKSHIKSISTRVKNINGFEEMDSLEVSKVDFDIEGRVISEKYFSLTDVILYSKEFRYKYNKSRQLVEKIKIQTEYPKDKKDSTLIDFTDYDPFKSKWTYKYNIDGYLIMENEFANHEDALPILVSEYEYDDKGNRVRGKFRSLKNPSQASNFNRVENYTYDENGNLIETQMNWTTIEYGTIQKFKYDVKNRLVFESEIDTDEGAREVRYIYKNDKLSRIEFSSFYFRKKQSIISNFQYSKTGCLIKETVERSSGETSITLFDCNEFGLPEIEDLTIGRKSCRLKTEYTFF